jgi:hypothetical protein
MPKTPTSVAELADPVLAQQERTHDCFPVGMAGALPLKDGTSCSQSQGCEAPVLEEHKNRCCGVSTPELIALLPSIDH